MIEYKKGVYAAEVLEDFVVVGCQKLPFDAIKNLAEAVKQAEAFNEDRVYA